MPEIIHSYDALMEIIVDRVEGAAAPFLIGIAGPPATGKSTLSERLVTDLNVAGTKACFCPMDGFHLTNAQLDAQDLREAKGRIDTFDAEAFVAAVQRLTARDSFWWPVYSRQRHDAIPEGTSISGAEGVYVIEGNYVLSEAEPWRAAGDAFNLRIFVDAPDETLRQRLLNRHQKSGRAQSEALEKIDRTDMPNAQTIRNERQVEDILFYERADD
ncbi:AAA family ATPase [Loktanella sp. Alg231-35]|uniref:AAA family ATPase n=1 Tax=Loktanella sp. Alg231-35 TaxID=1922220 RepID=UPI0019005165|nr:AAA family ATPase [Loktanella sp. Alg231-35]